jgi:sarcosine oxidase gamma subunit
MVAGEASRIEAAANYAVGRLDGCMVDQTGGVEVLSVTGPRGADLMVRLGSPTSLPAVGESRTSRMAEVTVTAFCVRSGETFLLVERVYAAHLLGWIRSTLADFEPSREADQSVG